MRPNPPIRAVLTAAALLALAGGCAQLGLEENPVDQTQVREEAGRREPQHVVVQHVLIAYDGAGIPGVTRTLPEAERLAGKVLDRARAGDSFDDLVRLYGDDRTRSGVLAVANFGVPLTDADEVERVQLVKAFGAAAFALEVGDITVVPFDETRSPFGFHVLTRLK